MIRELLLGSVHFNDLQCGVPRMSSALLAKRLKGLQLVSIVERRQGAVGAEYHLTAAGRELFPVVERMGLWAQRWLRHKVVDADNLDPDLLMWDIRRTVGNQLPPAIVATSPNSSFRACRSPGAATGSYSSVARLISATSRRVSRSIRPSPPACAC